MPAKCEQNASKMPAKCQQNASKMLAKCQQNGNKMPAKCQQNASKMPAKCLQNACKMPVKATRDSYRFKNFFFHFWTFYFPSSIMKLETIYFWACTIKLFTAVINSVLE